MEMSIDATEDKIARVYAREEWKTMAETSERTGMPVRSMCVSALTKYAIGDPDPAKSGRGMDIAMRSIELAEQLGVRIVMIPGYDIYYGTSTPESRQLFAENIRKIADAAACAGVIVGFETMENEFMNTVKKAMEYVNLCSSSYLQVYPDLGNITNAAVSSHGDVSADLETGRGALVAMHLKETRPGVFREVPYGEGHVDFEAGIRKAWELGVRRFVTEFWYTGQEKWQNEIAENCYRFRKILDEVER
jgi:L-ribulose-5-phosphate 3-epimerase